MTPSSTVSCSNVCMGMARDGTGVRINRYLNLLPPQHDLHATLTGTACSDRCCVTWRARGPTTSTWTSRLTATAITWTPPPGSTCRRRSASLPTLETRTSWRTSPSCPQVACLPVCLSVCIPVSACLSPCLPTCLPVCLSVCLSA